MGWSTPGQGSPRVTALFPPPVTVTSLPTRPGFTLIGRDPSTLCSGWLDQDVAPPALLWHKDKVQGTQSPQIGAFPTFQCVFLALIRMASIHRKDLLKGALIMISTNQSTALMDLDQWERAIPPGQATEASLSSSLSVSSLRDQRFSY